MTHLLYFIFLQVCHNNANKRIIFVVSVIFQFRFGCLAGYSFYCTGFTCPGFKWIFPSSVPFVLALMPHTLKSKDRSMCGPCGLFKDVHCCSLASNWCAIYSRPQTELGCGVIDVNTVHVQNHYNPLLDISGYLLGYLTSWHGCALRGGGGALDFWKVNRDMLGAP